jgi:3-oxoacyl-[acyl-carrier-protein] synthase II
MAEGAAMLVLERYDAALARGAHVYGEVAGFGTTNDAYHMTAPLPSGSANALAMRRALAESQLEPDDVDAVNAHGSATLLGDRAEAAALRLVFGARLATLPITATKGQHGHALGASGAWEAALALLALERRTIPRSVNCDEIDPECALAITGARLERAPEVLLSNSSGFGGINAALVFVAAR